MKEKKDYRIKRIWFINQYATPPSYGGLVRHYYFAKYLKKKHIAVKIFTASQIHNTEINMIKDHNTYIEKQVDGFRYTFIKTVSYSNNGWKRIRSMIEFPIRIWQVRKKFEKPDVMYASSPNPFVALSVILLSKKMKVKNIVEIRDLWPESIVVYNNITKKNLLIRLLYRLEKWIYVHADQLVFTMSGAEQYLKEKGWLNKIAEEKINFINNGIDLKEFDYNKKHFFLEDSDLDNKNLFKVLFTGSIRKVYHLDFLIDVAKELKRREQDQIKIIVYGDGTERRKLENRCIRENIDTIVFKGRIEKKYIASILGRADLNLIHLQKSHILRYGCSWNKLFEYMASGKPILSTVDVSDSSGLKRGITKIVHKATIHNVCDALIEIYNLSEEEKNNAGEIARATAENYSYEQLTDKLLKVLEK